MSEMQPIPPEESAEAAGPSGAYISARLRNPGATGAQAAAPAGNYTFAGICAIIAFVAYVVILSLLWQDWSALSVA